MARIGQDDKQPVEVEDKDIDFGEWMPLGDSLDTVAVSVRRMSGPEATPLVVTKVQNTTTVSKVWIAAGAHGARYRVTVTARTVLGRVKEVEFDIRVKEV